MLDHKVLPAPPDLRASSVHEDQLAQPEQHLPSQDPPVQPEQPDLLGQKETLEMLDPQAQPDPRVTKVSLV